MALPLGVVAAAILFVPIGATVFALVELLDDDTRRDRAFVGVLVVCGASTLALGAGGWVAGRIGAPGGTTSAIALGFLTGVVAVAAVVGAFYATFGEAMDFHSVGIALGWTEVPASELDGQPFPAVPPERRYDMSPSDLARERTLQAMAFVTAWGLLAIVATALGALAGASRRHAGSTAGGDGPR
jgi:hypothetical protein